MQTVIEFPGKKYAISKESWPAKRKCQAVLAKKSEKYDAEY